MYCMPYSPMAAAAAVVVAAADSLPDELTGMCAKHTLYCIGAVVA